MLSCNVLNMDTFSPSSLVADKIVFNSYYNMNSFLNSIQPFMSIVPDYRPKQLREKIAPKCSVLYFPVQMLQNFHQCLSKEENGAEDRSFIKDPLLTNDEQSGCTAESVHALTIERTVCDDLTESVHTVTTEGVASSVLILKPSQSEHILHIIWPHRW